MPSIKITGTLHEDQYTFLIISRSIILRIRNVSDKICRENQNTHFVFSNFPPPPPPSRAVHKIMWGNTGIGRQATDDNMAYARCMLDN